MVIIIFISNADLFFLSININEYSKSAHFPNVVTCRAIKQH